MIIKYPMDKEKLKELKAGDVVEFEGVIYTARDAAHMRMKKMLENKEALPVDFNDAFIYYAGPTPTKPGHVIVSHVHIDFKQTFQNLLRRAVFIRIEHVLPSHHTTLIQDYRSVSMKSSHFIGVSRLCHHQQTYRFFLLMKHFLHIGVSM